MSKWNRGVTLVSILAVVAGVLSACGSKAALDDETLEPTGEVAEAETAAPTETAAPSATPLPRHATIQGLEGTVQVKAAGAAAFGAAEIGMLLFEGDELQTGDDGAAVLEMDDGTVLDIAANSSLVVQTLDGTSENPVTRFFLNLGQIFSIRGADLPAGASYEIETPNGVAMIRGSAMGISYYEEGGGEVTCLIGHCGASLGDTLLEFGLAKSVTITEAISEIQDMDASQMQEWAAALRDVADAGLNVDEALTEPGCQCQGTDYVCADGTTIVGYAACLAGPECTCDGTTLNCSDGTSYENNPTCVASPSASCACSGPHLYCDDGSVVYNSQSCTSGTVCVCSGPNLVCGNTIYTNDPSCTRPADATCTCDQGFLFCDDGTMYFNTPECASDLPCVCQGTAMVCTIEGESFSFEHPACGGIPDYGGGCTCSGADMVCEDGTVYPGACGGTQPIDPGSNCSCSGADMVCADGTVYPGACGGAVEP